MTKLILALSIMTGALIELYVMGGWNSSFDQAAEIGRLIAGSLIWGLLIGVPVRLLWLLCAGAMRAARSPN